VPTRKKDLARIVDLAQLKPGEVFYELGCGGGGVAAFVAKNTEAKVIGLEIALPFYLLAKLRQLLNKRDNLQIKYKNLFSCKLTNVDLVYIFGMPGKLAKKLKTKFKTELTPGARIISYTFPIPGWTPSKVSKPSEKDLSIYLYQIK
jgi:cyclopropane fatty-acyl-phospholipid synthase-like methyltransferase